MPLPATEEHDLPRIDDTVVTRPALIVAFPTPAVLFTAKGTHVVGREWFLSVGIDDAKASGSHARLRSTASGLEIEDAGSRNGTYVDSQRLAEGKRVRLEDGAVVRMGRTLLVYRSHFSGSPKPDAPFGAMVGPYGLRDVAQDADRIAQTHTENVLLEGETGTGKELAARALADRLRPGCTYAAANVAGVASGVFEAQLFGHVAGAFSGASKAATGLLRAHHGGSVLLDELGELPLELQPKLLRALENREVLPVGASKPAAVDVLVIAATNRDLDDEVAAGRFRRDLLARFLQGRVELPPLRERREDIYAITAALCERGGQPLDAGSVEVEAVERLLVHPWPSNVRELAAAVARARASEPDGALRHRGVQRVLGDAPVGDRDAITREHAEAAVASAGGNQAQAARALGITRGKLLRTLRADG